MVIDANIVAGLYREAVGQDHSLTASPTAALDGEIGRGNIFCLDEGGSIKAEWANVVPAEWFEAWFSEFASQAAVASLPLDPCTVLLRRLRVDFGFPCGRDSKYVKTAKASSVSHGGRCTILTEDIDFFDPTAKGNAARRRKLLHGQSVGALARFLARAEDIDIRSLTLCV